MTDSQRLEKIVNLSGMSTRAFSHHIGLKGPQSLYDILKGRHGISKQMANRIHAKYLNFNLGWIMTGEGEMYEEDEKGGHNQLINDKHELYTTSRVSISQNDFSSLVDTLNRQQKTIHDQTKIIENLTQKKNPNNGNNNIAGSA